jgi:hypothetical protein
MDGTYIKLAVEALKLFLHSIPLGSKFNIISFGSDYAKLFPTSVEYGEETFAKALFAVKKFSADMGGTELFRPLKDVL